MTVSKNQQKPQPMQPPPDPPVSVGPRAESGGTPALSIEPLEFLWKVHGYTNEYIRFADSKAGIVLAVASALIAALFAAKAHEYCDPTRLSWENARLRPTVVGLLVAIALFSLLACVFCTSRCVAPRLWRKFFPSVREWFVSAVFPPAPQTGLIFWDDILGNQSAEAYWAAVQNATAETRGEAVARHIYVLAGICHTKFFWVSWAIRFGTPGALVTGLALILA